MHNICQQSVNWWLHELEMMEAMSMHVKWQKIKIENISVQKEKQSQFFKLVSWYHLKHGVIVSLDYVLQSTLDLSHTICYHAISSSGIIFCSMMPLQSFVLMVLFQYLQCVIVAVPKFTSSRLWSQNWSPNFRSS